MEQVVGSKVREDSLIDAKSEVHAQPSMVSRTYWETQDVPIDKFLHCQSRILRSISRKFSPRKTLIPLFDLAEDLLECTACSVEVVSHRSDLLHYLNYRNLSSELIQSTENKLARQRMSIGAQAIMEKKPLHIDLKSGIGSGLPEPVLSVLAEAGIARALALPLFGDLQDKPIGALTIYFAEAHPKGEQFEAIVEFLTEMAEHAALHRHSREAKKVADDRFEVLVDSVPGVVYQRVVTPDGKIRYTYISDTAQEMFGVSSEEILNDPAALFETHGGEYREGFHDRLIEASKNLTLWDVEATIVTRDGVKRYTHAIARPVKQADGTVVWNGIILDNTRIKEAEKATALVEKRTRGTIVESLNQGFVMFDAMGDLIISNDRLKEYYPELESVLQPGVSIAKFLAAERAFGLLGEEEIERGVIGLVVDIDPQTGLSPSVERHLKDGRWLLVQAYCLHGEEYVILYTDVSEIKDRQLALERSNRELQDFASVASHDLQEPLRKIEAFGGRLKDRCTDDLDEKGLFYLDRMQSAAERMRSLINDLLSYSRVTSQAKPFVACNMDKIVREVLSDLQMQVEENDAQVNISGLSDIAADPLQMRQLMQNIIGNALKYRREGVPLTVEIEGQRVHRDNREHLEIKVTDNGIGFDMRFAEKIFNVFQRLHGQNEYAGTGIGLATCRKIVERHLGEIHADSVEGEGSVFSIFIPVLQNQKDEV